METIAKEIYFQRYSGIDWKLKTRTVKVKKNNDGTNRKKSGCQQGGRYHTGCESEMRITELSWLRHK